MKTRLQRAQGPGGAVAPSAPTVDIIVPVYRGLADTQRCLESVLASHCATPWRLVVINDASPEPVLAEWLRRFRERDERVLLLENEENLGFVGTVNRGMSAGAEHDVLLLNSDTEVANDWLDRLRRSAYSDTRVASVTPFSNNATICSYPRFCQPNALPPGWDTAELDAVFARINAGQVIDIPTGVGFCMYLRRDALKALGLFDAETFGKGYGEENDFCRRAAKRNWRNLHALDTFVLHTGGVSFGASKSHREVDAAAKLLRLHPDYDILVHKFIASDAAWAARTAVDIARLRASGRHKILAVVHNRAGGTLRHVNELASGLQDRAIFLVLSPVPGGRVELELLEAGAAFKLEFSLPAQWPSLLQALRSIGISHVHYHHLLGHCAEIRNLGKELGVRWDFTAHDYYVMCRNVCLMDENERFCGEQGGSECNQCADQPGAIAGEPELQNWRAAHHDLVAISRHVFVPSRDTGRRFARRWPAADIRLAPHTDLPAGAQVLASQARPLDGDRRLRIAVIGALSRFKGADLLEDVAQLAARDRLPMEFHLIGYAYRDLRKSGTALTVHGSYNEADLPMLLSEVKPDLVWFPVLVPETYSYTLSACLRAGLPVVAPNLGAFPERLSGRKWSWVRPWDTPAQDWPAFFEQLRQAHFTTGESPRPHWEAAPTPQDALLGSWSYDTDYLAGVVVAQLPAESPDAAFLLAHRAGAGAGLDRHRRRIKQLALSVIVRLRSAPPLRRVARAIPLRWQTRVKSWLRA